MISRQATSGLKRRAMLPPHHHLPSRRLLGSRSSPPIPETRSSSPTVRPPKLNIYRDVWPPVLSCLGLAFVSFYGLELWRTNLDYKYHLQDQAVEIEALKAEVETLRQENERKQSSMSNKVLGRLGVGSNGSDPEGRSKWFGIF